MTPSSQGLESPGIPGRFTAGDAVEKSSVDQMKESVGKKLLEEATKTANSSGNRTQRIECHGADCYDYADKDDWKYDRTPTAYNPARIPHFNDRKASAAINAAWKDWLENNDYNERLHKAQMSYLLSVALGDARDKALKGSLEWAVERAPEGVLKRLGGRFVPGFGWYSNYTTARDALLVKDVRVDPQYPKVDLDQFWE
jgi:hypothetical protein